MRDWAFALMICVIIISVASCTAVGIVSSNKQNVELEKLKYEHQLKN